MPRLNKAGWTVTASSNPALLSRLIDGNYTLDLPWGTTESGYPHWVTIDFGSARPFDSFEFTPYFQSQPQTVELYVSNDGINWGSAVASATWTGKYGSAGASAMYMMMPRQTARYVKFVAVTGPGGGGASLGMAACEIDFILEQGHNRYGWTATASSSFDADHGPECAVDEYNRYNYTFWLSGDSVAPGNSDFPHWIAVDMGSAKPINYIKYVPATTGAPVFTEDQLVPLLVRAYVSDDGTNWTQVGEQVWPQDKRTHWVYFTDSPGSPGNLTTHVCRYFKLEGVTDEGRLSQGRMACAEIYAGELHEGDDYKAYWKVHPTVLEDFTPAIDPSRMWGNVEYLSLVGGGGDLQAAKVSAKIKLWASNPLAYYPEFCCSVFDFPERWKVLTLESLSAVLEGQHLDSAYIITASQFSLRPNRGSAQEIVEDQYSPWIDVGEWSYAKISPLYDVATGWYDILTADYFDTFYVNVLIAQSSSMSAPSHLDADCSRLLIEDLYLLLVYAAIYALPPAGGGGEGGGGGGGPAVEARNDAMLLIDLSEAAVLPEY